MNKKIIFIFKIILAFVLLGILIQKIEPNNLQNAFANSRPGYIFLALLLVVPNVGAQFIKWRFMLRLIKPDVSHFEVASSLLAGFALGFVTPGRIGEFGRALFIQNCSRTQVVGLALIDKMASMCLIFLMGAVGLFFLLGIQLNSTHFYLWLGLALVAVVLVFLLAWFPEKLRKSLKKLQNVFPSRKKVSLLVSSLDNFNRKQAIQMLGLAFVFYAIITTQYVLLLQAFEPIAYLIGYLVVGCIFITKSLLPISLGDLGIRETAAVFFIGLIGGQEATAFNASILIFGINLVLPSLIGFLLLLTPKLNEQLVNLKMRW